VTLQIGDRVVTMSYPGIFTVLEIDGQDVTIASADGSTTRVVHAVNVRRLNPRQEAES